MLSDFDAPEYLSIDKQFLLLEDLEIRFDVFIRVPGSARELPVLFSSGANAPEHVKGSLKLERHAEFCVSRQDYHKFLASLEDTLSRAIANDRISLPQKASLLHSCATDTIKAVFSDPRSGKNIERTKKLANSMIEFALSNHGAIPSLLKLGSHDYYTFSHSVNVAVFSLGFWLTLNRGAGDELHDLALGCILHDVGKTQVDDAIINKRGKLTDEEFALVKKHPRQGYDLMVGKVSDISLDIILHHHEKYDGSGYPYGLQGNDTSDYAKIAAIADCYDALTTKRSYAEARQPFAAILLMKEQMVGHFERKKFTEFIYFLGGRHN